MAKYKWFWLTFFSWCLIATVSAWALIYSPIDLTAKRLCELKANVNGDPVHSQILVTSTSIHDSLDMLTKRWQNQGWNCVSQKINLAAALVNIPQKYMGSLNSLVEARMFKSKDSYRLLGLYRDIDHEQTYQWITDLPQKVLSSKTPSEISFPLKPPVNSMDVLDIEFEKTEACLWSMSTSENPDDEFSNLYASEGFSGKIWTKETDETVYILHRGATRLLALVQTEEGKSFVTVLKIDKN